MVGCMFPEGAYAMHSLSHTVNTSGVEFFDEDRGPSVIRLGMTMINEMKSESQDRPDAVVRRCLPPMTRGTSTALNTGSKSST
jgi:hypothetical protein